MECADKLHAIQTKMDILKSQKSLSYLNCFGIFLIVCISFVLYRRMCQKQIKSIGTFQYKNHDKYLYRNVFKN